MATEKAHVEKAKSNQKFLDTITDDFPDWMAIVAFYAAVHWVEAFFAKTGAPSHSHQQRNAKLRRNHPAIWRHFRPLFHASKLLRYSDHVMTVEHVRTELIAKRLRSVESLILQRLT